MAKIGESSALFYYRERPSIRFTEPLVFNFSVIKLELLDVPTNIYIYAQILSCFKEYGKKHNFFFNTVMFRSQDGILASPPTLLQQNLSKLIIEFLKTQQRRKSWAEGRCDPRTGGHLRRDTGLEQEGSQEAEE